MVKPFQQTNTKKLNNNNNNRNIDRDTSQISKDRYHYLLKIILVVSRFLKMCLYKIKVQFLGDWSEPSGKIQGVHKDDGR